MTINVTQVIHTDSNQLNIHNSKKLYIYGMEKRALNTPISDDMLLEQANIFGDLIYGYDLINSKIQKTHFNKY